MEKEDLLQTGEELNKKPEPGADPEPKEPEAEELPEDGEDSITLNKPEYDKLIEERDNYKTENELWRTGKKTLSQKKQLGGEYVTKADLRKEKEKEALRASFVQFPDLKEHWKEIVEFVPRVLDTDLKEDIEKKIKAGYHGWKAVQESDEKEENKEAKADLALNKGKGSKTSPPAQKKKDRFLPEAPTKPSEWY